MTDSLERATDEHRTWLDQLHRRHGAWFWARLVRRYGVQEAEDLVQDTWLRVSRLCSAGDIRTPKAFLLKVAANIAHGRTANRIRLEQTVSDVRGLDSWGVQEATQGEEVLARQMVLSLPQPLRDRIVVGEMRDGPAALETLKSWNTGHPGGLSTIHANSGEDVLRRLEDLILEVVVSAPRRMIVQAVDCIVHIRRTPQGRRLEGVFAVDGLCGEDYRLRRLA